MTLEVASPATALALASDPDATVVTLCEQGSQAIEQAATLADAKDIRDWADTIEHATKVRDLNHETIILAGALKIRAERRIGQLLGPAKHAEPGVPRNVSTASETLSKDDRHQSRRLAEPSDDEFDEILDEAANEARDKAGIARRQVLTKIDERKRDEADQAEWVASLGDDPNPDATKLRSNAHRAAIGITRAINKLMDSLSPHDLAKALHSYPERQHHVRDQIMADLEYAADELTRYTEVFR